MFRKCDIAGCDMAAERVREFREYSSAHRNGKWRRENLCAAHFAERIKKELVPQAELARGRQAATPC